jgi:chromosome segregation ATPase
MKVRSSFNYLCTFIDMDFIAHSQLTIKKLEEQVVELKEQSTEGSREKINDLQSKFEKSSENERQWQQKHSDLEVRFEALQQQLSQIREGIPDTVPKQMQAIMSFRTRIMDLEKEGKHLSETTTAFERRVSDATRAPNKDSTTLEAFEKEYAVQQERINRLEDITKMQLHDINRLLIEANYLNGINNKSGDASDTAPGMSE